MEKVVHEKMFDNQVSKIILNDPKGNVIDSIMMKSFQETFDEIEANKNCKMIIFQGSGKHFSFGVSVEEHTEELASEMLSSFHGLFIRLSELSVPVCSLISGQCLGGGMELVIFSHFAFADQTALMAQPEIVLSVFAPPASIMLPMKIGHSRAEEFILTGRSIDAQEAKQLGIINEVYPDKETMEYNVNDWIAKNIIPKSAYALKIANRALRYQFNKRIKEELDICTSIYLNEVMRSHDGKEGLDSFLEKRKPMWRNE